jgi:hypothetical protein
VFNENSLFEIPIPVASFGEDITKIYYLNNHLLGTVHRNKSNGMSSIAVYSSESDPRDVASAGYIDLASLPALAQYLQAAPARSTNVSAPTTQPEATNPARLFTPAQPSSSSCISGACKP